MQKVLTASNAQEKKDTTELQEKSKELKKGIVVAEEHAKEVAEARDKAIMPIGNLVPDSVPVSNDEVCASSLAAKWLAVLATGFCMGPSTSFKAARQCTESHILGRQ